jgi:hypothetical protein
MPAWCRGEEAAGGLKTVATWTLTPTKGVVLLRMEQSGFRSEDETDYRGANYGWRRYIGSLERVAARLAETKQPGDQPDLVTKPEPVSPVVLGSL